MNSHWISRIVGIGTLGLVLGVAGCSNGNYQEPEPIASPSASDSTLPPTEDATMPPSASGSPNASPTDPASVVPTTAALTLFYIAVGDEGISGPQIGCGDSIVATETAPMEFTDQVGAAISTLLASDESEHGESGLRNALAESELNYISARVADDTVTVELSGQVQSGGTCDDPRIIEQLKYTAMTAAGTGNAVIRLNGEDLEQVLSGK